MFDLRQGVTVFCDNEFCGAGDKLTEYFELFFDIGKGDAPVYIIKKEMSDEHYEITITDSEAKISAGDLRGAVYGVSALLQMVDRKSLKLSCTTLTDGPYKPFRGAHLYLPARENIDVYLRILEALAFFKMNTVIIEVGGAMEYRRHPEINEKWEWFCDFCDNTFPGEGKSRSLQWADTYWKDSVHTEHAGGSFLTQAEVGRIVDYAKGLGLEVIPEIQALSHAYYLTLAHREIAELSDDMFPDSYCPLNEKSYELYFDVAEEVIEVFKPSMVSIGHDEIRILGQCDKCREKTGHELLSYEINRLHEFYKSKNIRIVMWGEKLQYYKNYKGAMEGEAIDKITPYGFRYTLPATYEAKHTIPKDILMLDWQYSLSHYSQDDFSKDGFESAFGNFRGSRILNWKKRSSLPAMTGAEVSTWVVTDEKTFARDGIFYEFAFSGNMLWDKDYDEASYEDMTNRVINQMFYTKAIIRKKAQKNYDTEVLFASDSGAPVDTGSAAVCDYNVSAAIKKYPDIIYGAPIDTTSIIIKKEFYTEGLLFFHSAKCDMPYVPSHKFPDYSPYGIGAYIVLYEDGTVECVNIDYGVTVGNIDFKIKCGNGRENIISHEIDDEKGEFSEGVTAPTFEPVCSWNDSILYDTVPVITDGGTVFSYLWKNPHPDKKIIKIKATNTCRDKNQAAMLFGISTVKEEK